MSYNNYDNDGSVLDGAATMVGAAIFIYVLFLSIPVLAYVDLILTTAFTHIQPDSPFGKFFTVIFFGLLPAILIGKFLLSFASRFFLCELAGIIFLYAQGLFFISFVGISQYAITSEIIVRIISKGFNEPMTSAATIVLIIAIIVSVVSIIIEAITRKVAAENYRRSLENNI